MPAPARKKAGRNKAGKQSPGAGPKLGRPATVIPWDMVDRMCAIHCTMQEIADVLDIPLSTLENGVKRDFHTTMREYFRKKSAHGKMSLRRSQYEQAVGRPNVYDSKGRVTHPFIRPTWPASQWLGRQWLNQTDDGTPEPESEFENYDDDAGATPLPADIIAR